MPSAGKHPDFNRSILLSGRKLRSRWELP